MIVWQSKKDKDIIDLSKDVELLKQKIATLQTGLESLQTSLRSIRGYVYKKFPELPEKEENINSNPSEMFL